MRVRALIHRITLFAAVLVPAASVTGADPLNDAKASENRLFGLTRVVPVHIELAAEEYQALQPAMPSPPGTPPRAPKPRKPGARAGERNLFGVEFPWAAATVTIDGRKIRHASIRYAGNASYMASATGLKRSFFIDLQDAEPRRFHGLTAFSLKSGALDPSRMREALGQKLFHEAGVPAARTALAEVTLTVPGLHNKSILGLYTLVEPINLAFFKDRFGAPSGLLVRPQGLRGLDVLGDDWSPYRGPYRPIAQPPAEAARRFIAFLKLVEHADDARFHDEIQAYLDVDRFLRFMAAQALIANADGFFTLAYNYALALDPRTNRLVFIPGDQDLAFANFLMMGSAGQLMDMSLAHPYSNPNRLADRLLAIPEIRGSYTRILAELANTVFRKEKLLADIDAVEETIAPIVARELAAREERGEPPAALGPPGFPTAPDLRTFAETRSRSIADQLTGKREGYRPRFNFGPAVGAAPPRPVDDATINDVVKAPPDFQVSLFAAPPRISYPVTLYAAPDGTIYVAVDEQGSLGRAPGGGRVVRLVDDDGDGKADRSNGFARMEHPRGVIALEGKVWVLHPPFLSLFRDDNGDGVSDAQEVLVSGLTTSLIDERGGDHTTNGIRMGLDGWIYIAVGDYGFHHAKGKDGVTLSQRGGGILRVRPDGTELEIHATGLRNPFAIAIDSFMNLFTRDNTNDGGGWDVRVSHLLPTADYGYSQRFASDPDEIMTPLGAFGQGGGTGALAIEDVRWPAVYQGALLTGDWGRSEVYRHELTPTGASFLAKTGVFLSVPRTTGMDIGPDGRLYVASWRGGEASVYVGPQVGFVACVCPPGWKSSPVVDPRTLRLDELVEGLCGPNAVSRFFCQRALVGRGRNTQTTMMLESLVLNPDKPLAGRVAALFALKDLNGEESHATLAALTRIADLREFALKALADRKSQLRGVSSALFRNALADPSPRVRAQALIGLGRLGAVDAAPRILPLTSRPDGSAPSTVRPVHAQPDPDRAVPHLAVRTLVALHAIDACLSAIDGPYRSGALQALRSMHDVKTVDGLSKKLDAARTTVAKREILATLVRLYHREADYDGSWWGIRPDTTGPYFDPRDWEGTAQIAGVLRKALRDCDASTAEFLRNELARRRVQIEGISAGVATRSSTESEKRVLLAKPDPRNPNQIGNLAYEEAARRVLASRGDPARGKALFTAHSCQVCHTDAEGQTPKGPHLVDIGKRSTAAELVESILKPGAKIAQGYESYHFALSDGRVYSGFVVSEGPRTVLVRESSGIERTLERGQIEARRRQESSIMPEGIAAALTPEALADLVAYLQSLDSTTRNAPGP